MSNIQRPTDITDPDFDRKLAAYREARANASRKRYRGGMVFSVCITVLLYWWVASWFVERRCGCNDGRYPAEELAQNHGHAAICGGANGKELVDPFTKFIVYFVGAVWFGYLAACRWDTVSGGSDDWRTYFGG